MNDQDKEAFDKWHYENISNPPTINDLIAKAWQDACKHKQKEIDVIESQLNFSAKIINSIQIDKYELQSENVKLKDALRFYADKYDSGHFAKIVLKQLDV